MVFYKMVMCYAIITVLFNIAKSLFRLKRGFAMISKKFLTIEDQVSKLKSLGFDLKELPRIKAILSENSFYNIINGYRQPFLFLNVPNRYIKGIDFFEIYGLYFFDRQLRNAFFPHLLDIENKIKSEIIYEFSSSRDSSKKLIHDGDAYLHIDSYDVSKSKRNQKYKDAIDLISLFHRTISKYFYSSESISHYMISYGYVPLWVLSTHLTFGDISKFYCCLKPQNRQNISKKYFMSDDDLASILKVLTAARNSCAHGNRMFCHFTNDLPLPSNLHYPTQYRFITLTRNDHKLFNVLIAIKYFVSKKRFKALINSIDTLFTDLSHQLKCIQLQKIQDIMGFPPDWKVLL